MTVRHLALPLMLAGLALAGAALAADPSPVGVWKTPEDHGLIRIYECGAALCGRIVGSDTLNANPGLKDAANKDAALRGRPLKDLQLMSGFKGGPKTWKDGRIYRPQDGGTYKGSLELVEANKLKLTGCAAPLLCQSQTWVRAK
ncbi:MAG: DUF2147 domain-containing protein [Caulobacter sp.]|nr:DUF2147 domain-containing protein [Caulobacter sp.]